MHRSRPVGLQASTCRRQARHRAASGARSRADAPRCGRAVNQQKDIVFDGTMTWAPFVKQTLAMVRDHRHNYRRGPGYTVDESGHAIELCARRSRTGLLRYLIRRVRVWSWFGCSGQERPAVGAPD